MNEVWMGIPAYPRKRCGSGLLTRTWAAASPAPKSVMAARAVAPNRLVPLDIAIPPDLGRGCAIPLPNAYLTRPPPRGQQLRTTEGGRNATEKRPSRSGLEVLLVQAVL